MLRHLPKHLLPVVHAPSRKCTSCASFSLKAGQEAMRSNPYFLAAAQVVSPAEMGRRIVDAETGTKEPLPATAQKWKWEDFGLCKKHDNIVWRADTCADWRTGVPGAIRKALFGDEADFV